MIQVMTVANLFVNSDACEQAGAAALTLRVSHGFCLICENCYSNLQGQARELPL